MIDPELFLKWAVSISGGSVFLVLVSIYLYTNSKSKRGKTRQMIGRALSLPRDFIFVWVLLGLLFFYIITIEIGSAPVFAAGNVIVETLLILYLLRNRTKSE
jgi:Flp pilus assembly protein TadB